LIYKTQKNRRKRTSQKEERNEKKQIKDMIPAVFEGFGFFKKQIEA
jgi:hypothetical protein